MNLAQCTILPLKFFSIKISQICCSFQLDQGCFKKIFFDRNLEHFYEKKLEFFPIGKYGKFAAKCIITKIFHQSVFSEAKLRVFENTSTCFYPETLFPTKPFFSFNASVSSDLNAEKSPESAGCRVTIFIKKALGGRYFWGSDFSEQY